jgi:hypothetical protein
MTQLENFVQETGFRFRMTNIQTARVALTTLSVDDRSRIAAMSIDDAAAFFKAVSPKGKALGWVKKAVELAGNWRDEFSLSRDSAFGEFIAGGGADKVKQRKPEVPLVVWTDPELTLENFEEKSFKATGHKIRFRIPKEQKSRQLSRAEALAEIIALKRAEVK